MLPEVPRRVQDPQEFPEAFGRLPIPKKASRKLRSSQRRLESF